MTVAESTITRVDRRFLVRLRVRPRCPLLMTLRQLRLFRFQHLHSLGKRRVGGHPPEVAEYLFGGDRDILEQENLARKLQGHARDVP